MSDFTNPKVEALAQCCQIAYREGREDGLAEAADVADNLKNESIGFHREPNTSSLTMGEAFIAGVLNGAGGMRLITKRYPLEHAQRHGAIPQAHDDDPRPQHPALGIVRAPRHQRPVRRRAHRQAPGENDQANPEPVHLPPVEPRQNNHDPIPGHAGTVA